MKTLPPFMVALLLHYAMAADAANEKPVSIPLKSIWAYEMPGTQDITTLEEKSTEMIDAIRRALGPPTLNKPGPTKMPNPRSGFAVKGVGRDALRQAYAVLVKEQKEQTSFAAGSDISVVFFSLQGGRYVHLDKVLQQGTTYTIYFKLVPHETANATEHFAIIPLPNLKPGSYEVKTELVPLDKKYLNLGFMPLKLSDVSKRVSGPFKFSVAD